MSGIDEGRLDKSIGEACLLLYFGNDIGWFPSSSLGTDAHEALLHVISHRSDCSCMSWLTVFSR